MNEVFPAVAPDDDRLFADVSRMVSGARERVTRTVNQELTMLHWQVGARIRAEILNYERAEYGERVLAKLAERLTNEFGRGWSRESLSRMVRFASIYPDREIVSSLMTPLTWTHFLQLISIEDESERRFYTSLLCTESDPALVALPDLNADDIHVSKYLTERLPMAALRAHVEAAANSHELDE
jgi:hypothetical protein